MVPLNVLDYKDENNPIATAMDNAIGGEYPGAGCQTLLTEERSKKRPGGHGLSWEAL
jgi:hypothetical protein